MKKTITRIAACSLAVLIAFNTVAIPKSKAVIVESALVSAFVATYSAAAGFAYRGEPFPGTEQMPAVYRTIEQFVYDFADAVEMTHEQFEAEILAGATLLKNGVVQFGASAANLLKDFHGWLIDKLGLSAGSEVVVNGDCIPFTDADGVARVAYQVFYDEVNKCWLPPDHLLTVPLGGLIQSDVRYLNGDLWSSWGRDGTLRLDFYHDGEDVVNYNYNWEYDLAGYLICFLNTSIGVQHGIITYDSNGVFVDVATLNYSWNSAANAFGTDNVSDVAIGLVAGYESPPTVNEQYSMVIDTGMTFADEQEFIDAVLGGVAAGTLSPTYDIEYATNRDVVVPGEVTDTQAGILSSVKTIAQRVKALPQSIAEAVKSIFVPDAALTTAITGAFSEKFAFVPQLHQLGTDLLNMGPDSGPPVIYIHLEDAEGTIDYGGTVKALDMSWYERYKEDGDRIIGGFLWLGFLWMLFKRTAAIIKGGEMVSEYGYDIDNGYRGSGRGGRHL